MDKMGANEDRIRIRKPSDMVKTSRAPIVSYPHTFIDINSNETDCSYQVGMLAGGLSPSMHESAQ